MRIPAFLALVLSSGCASSDGGPAPVWDPASDALFDMPWPTDARLRTDGSPDLSGFPNPYGIPMIDKYLSVSEGLRGYGANGPIYLRFHDPIDAAALPTPAESVEAGSPLILVDVDPRSPYWGERVPVQWEFTETATTYQPSNLLAVAPVWGFPLRRDTTYALIVTTGMAARDEGFREALRDDPLYAPLHDALFWLGLEPSDVAVATVFTTGDPLEEMDRLAAFIHDSVEPPDLSQTLTRQYATIFYEVYTGGYPAPLFQHGDRPYASTGGGFRFDEAGTPQIYAWEDLRMAVCVPRDLSSPPEGGWPVVIQQHGTGGDWLSHCEGTTSMEVGARVAKSGMISIGIDQPLHGARGTPDTQTDLHTFNYLNPESARANFRQGALDAIYLANALAARPATFVTDDGKQLVTDPERVYFFGHSQGGLTGALATPFMGEDVGAVVLSGAGGGLAITMVERKDPTDIAAMIETVGQFGPDEPLTELHPVAGMVQLLTDVTDPLNYAPYWFAEDGGLSGGEPTSVLLTSGLLDVQTPHRTAEALAAAGRLPQLEPEANTPESLALRSIAPMAPPLEGNVTAWDGAVVTSAISQWPDNTHFAVWENKDLAELYQAFLETAAYEGEAELIESR
jgi:predicted esterase